MCRISVSALQNNFETLKSPLSLPAITGHIFSISNLNSLNCQDYLAQLLHPAFLSSH